MLLLFFWHLLPLHVPNFPSGSPRIILHIRRVLRAVVRVIASPKPVKCEVLFVCATALYVSVPVSICVCVSV